ALTSAQQTQVGGVLVDRHQFGGTAVGGDGRVDLVGEDVLDLVGQRPAQITLGGAHLRRSGRVGVVHRQPLGRQLQGGARELVDVGFGDDYGQVPMPLQALVLLAVRHRNEGEVV